MLGHADRSWRTHDLEPSDQFAAWEGMVAEAFTPVTVRRAPEYACIGFLSSCAVRTIGDLGIAWLDTGAQQVERTDRHVAHDAAGMYFLNLPLASEGRAVQDDRVSITGAGDFVLVNSDRPFTLEFATRFQQLSLAIPHDLLDPLLADPERASCVVVKGDSGAGAIASAAVRSLAAQTGRLSPREARGVTEHLLGLLALAVSSTPELGLTSVRARRYQGVLDEIERRLADPDLRPIDVARELAISLSYLTKLFAEHGTSFGRHLLARRLDRAHALLSTEPATVTEVATACGFTDSGHFARAFRARFGLTPSASRAARAETRA